MFFAPHPGVPYSWTSKSRPLNCTISISMWVQAVLAAKRPELHHMIFRKHNLSGKKLATMVLVAFQTLLRCIIPFSLTCRHCHSTGDVWSKLAQIQTVMPFSLCRFDPMPTNSGGLIESNQKLSLHNPTNIKLHQAFFCRIYALEPFPAHGNNYH